MKCGLLGRKLGHSFSPQIHAQLANYTYSLFEKEPDELEAFLLNSDIHGFNVTIPYKKQVIPYCDELSPRAKQLGAVNTIIRRDDGTLWGHNTDYYGFQTMLDHTHLSVVGKKALVLGSGGASATAAAVLQDVGAKVIVISRSGENNYSNLDLHKDCALIVNTTPVGMYPDVENAALDLRVFPKLEGVLDVIYNPARTKLLMQAEQMGLITENGLLMLVAQAKESAEWFSGHAISDEIISSVYSGLKKQTENIILIGMPGCGKSTVGAEISRMTGMRFVDADLLFLEKYGTTPAEVITHQGEELFRKMETAVIADIGKESGYVIATGGGCVTRPENYAHLHRNGRIYYIMRDLSLLPTSGRPLSQKNALYDMYTVRDPLYRSFSDVIVDNNGSVEESAMQIVTNR